MRGAVWFGKLGQMLAQQRIDTLNQQIENRIPTFLYLVKGNRRRSTAYRAPLVLLSRARPKESKLIPAYYADKHLLRYMKTWMKIEGIEPIEMSTMSRLRAMNSVFPIAETLVLSSSGHFLVRESKSIL
jgi:hypothetical protein